MKNYPPDKNYRWCMQLNSLLGVLYIIDSNNWALGKSPEYWFSFKGTPGFEVYIERLLSVDDPT